MNKRLDDAIDAARRTLSDEAQEELAALVEDYVWTHNADLGALLTPDQVAELERRMGRPFNPGDGESIKALFAKHGIQADF
jgi:hypothetical protein